MKKLLFFISALFVTVTANAQQFDDQAGGASLLLSVGDSQEGFLGEAGISYTSVGGLNLQALVGYERLDWASKGLTNLDFSIGYNVAALLYGGEFSSTTLFYLTPNAIVGFREEIEVAQSSSGYKVSASKICPSFGLGVRGGVIFNRFSIGFSSSVVRYNWDAPVSNGTIKTNYRQFRNDVTIGYDVSETFSVFFTDTYTSSYIDAIDINSRNYKNSYKVGIVCRF